MTYGSSHVYTFHSFTSPDFWCLWSSTYPSAKQQQEHLIQGFPPSATPFPLQLFALPLSFFPPPQTALCTFPFYSLCVSVCVQAGVCECVCMNVLVCTVICVFGRKMSVTGFEREHVCPRTYRIPTLYPATPFPSHSASLAPPPPSPFSMLHTARPTKCYTKKPISTHMLLPRFTHPPRAPTYSYTGFDLL